MGERRATGNNGNRDLGNNSNVVSHFFSIPGSESRSQASVSGTCADWRLSLDISTLRKPGFAQFIPVARSKFAHI